MVMMSILAASLTTSAPEHAGRDGPSLENVSQAPQETSLVVGSIRYRKHRVDSACGELLGQCHIIVQPPQGAEPIVYSFKEGGPFTWALPAGDYVVVGLDRGRNGKSMSYVFHAPEGNGAIYVGELTIDVTDNGLRIWLEDNFDTAAPRFDARFPERAGSLKRSLLGSYGNPGTWDEVLPICSAGWGVSCSRSRQGLVPVLPTKARGPFFAIKDAQPRFEWAASKIAGLQYDFALFDAVLFDGMPYRGRIVTYKQGIEEPFWQLTQTLIAGRPYYWSVRLRRGGIVSTWSTHTASYSTGFLGMNATAAYGEWFRIDAPVNSEAKKN